MIFREEKLLRYSVSGEGTCEWFTFRRSARRAFRRKEGTMLLFQWKRDGELVLLDEKVALRPHEGRQAKKGKLDG